MAFTKKNTRHITASSKINYNRPSNRRYSINPSFQPVSAASLGKKKESLKKTPATFEEIQLEFKQAKGDSKPTLHLIHDEIAENEELD